MPEINEKEFNRHFAPNFFKKYYEELLKVVSVVNEFYGQVDFQIRPHNVFTVYHLGQSLGRVEPPSKTSEFRFTIHISASFEVENCLSATANSKLKNEREKNGTLSFELEKFSDFFSKTCVKKMCGKIKKVNHQTERQIQQKILADNMSSPDFFIIDSEVSIPGFRERLDLLGLRKTEKGKYRLVLLELKLINNEEAKNKDVIEQIEGYAKVFNDKIESITSSYEINYNQKRQLGIYEDNFPADIKIEKTVIEKAIIIADGWKKAKELKRNLEKDCDLKNIKIIIMHMDLAKEYA